MSVTRKWVRKRTVGTKKKKNQQKEQEAENPQAASQLLWIWGQNLVSTNVTFLTLNTNWQTSHVALKDAWFVQQLVKNSAINAADDASDS